MSRFLSEIKIDVPIDYKVEDSKAVISLMRIHMNFLKV